jgi:hypothetical protein
LEKTSFLDLRREEAFSLGTWEVLGVFLCGTRHPSPMVCGPLDAAFCLISKSWGPWLGAPPCCSHFWSCIFKWLAVSFISRGRESLLELHGRNKGRLLRVFLHWLSISCVEGGVLLSLELLDHHHQRSLQ